MKSTASQSSSSGCDGADARVPKSSAVSTRPTPKIACQTRFTATRAVSGDRLSASQRAKVSRVAGSPAGSGCNAAGTCGATRSFGRSQPPRSSRKVSRASSGLRSARCRTEVFASGNCFHSASDLVVERFELRHALPPRGENFRRLLRRALLAGRLQGPHGGVGRGIHLRVGRWW